MTPGPNAVSAKEDDNNGFDLSNPGGSPFKKFQPFKRYSVEGQKEALKSDVAQAVEQVAAMENAKPAPAPQTESAAFEEPAVAFKRFKQVTEPAETADTPAVEPVVEEAIEEPVAAPQTEIATDVAQAEPIVETAPVQAEAEMIAPEATEPDVTTSAAVEVDVSEDIVTDAAAAPEHTTPAEADTELGADASVGQTAIEPDPEDISDQVQEAAMVAPAAMPSEKERLKKMFDADTSPKEPANKQRKSGKIDLGPLSSAPVDEQEFAHFYECLEVYFESQIDSLEVKVNKLDQAARSRLKVKHGDGAEWRGFADRAFLDLYDSFSVLRESF